MTIIQLIMSNCNKEEVCNKVNELKAFNLIDWHTANCIYNYCIWHWGL